MTVSKSAKLTVSFMFNEHTLSEHPLRLTLRSSRTPPALPSALSQQFAISASFIASVQARPLSLIR
jgi:hypothetical protein